MRYKVRKYWEKPALIRLVKSQEEEKVLAGCKDLMTMSGPTQNDEICYFNSGFCQMCNAILPS